MDNDCRFAGELPEERMKDGKAADMDQLLFRFRLKCEEMDRI